MRHSNQLHHNTTKMKMVYSRPRNETIHAHSSRYGAASYSRGHATQRQLSRLIALPRDYKDLPTPRHSRYPLVSQFLCASIEIFRNVLSELFTTNMKRFRYQTMLAFSWLLVAIAPNPKRLSAYRKRLSEYNRWYFTSLTKKY